MKVAALDLGSNTFLCLIAEIENQKIQKIYSDQVEIVRLGQDVNKTKMLHPEALIRAKKALENFKKTIDVEKPEAILAMATSAARDSNNRHELFQICSDLNIPLEIIPGDQEAEITYKGSTSGQIDFENQQLVIDIGGGSTEFIIGSHQKLRLSQSLNIGCVRLTEQFISEQPTPHAEIEKLTLHIHEQIQKFALKNTRPLQQILAVAGTPTTIAAVELGYFDSTKIDGYVLTLDGLTKWLNKVIPLTIDEKIQLGFPKGRADVIVVGLIILIETMKIFNLNQLKVSTRGVRFGIALELAQRFNC